MKMNNLNRIEPLLFGDKIQKFGDNICFFGNNIQNIGDNIKKNGGNIQNYGDNILLTF